MKWAVCLLFDHKSRTTPKLICDACMRHMLHVFLHSSGMHNNTIDPHKFAKFSHDTKHIILQELRPTSCTRNMSFISKNTFWCARRSACQRPRHLWQIASSQPRDDHPLKNRRKYVFRISRLESVCAIFKCTHQIQTGNIQGTRVWTKYKQL